MNKHGGRWMNRLRSVGLLCLVFVTGGLSRLDLGVPSKWSNLLDGLAASSGLAHLKLSALDEDVLSDYLEAERQLERRFGVESFYSEQEIEAVNERKSSVEVGA